MDAVYKLKEGWSSTLKVLTVDNLGKNLPTTFDGLTTLSKNEPFLRWSRRMAGDMGPRRIA